MKQVKVIPGVEYAAKRDPWLDKLFDGKLRELTASDWDGRYKGVRSAASAIKQAAKQRDLKVTVSIRGQAVYVQAKLNGHEEAPAPRRRRAKAS